MRASRTCPKCGFTKLFHITETGHDGLFEAFVCRGCGFTETYLRDDTRDKLEAIPGVRRIKGAPKPGPYR